MGQIAVSTVLLLRLKLEIVNLKFFCDAEGHPPHLVVITTIIATNAATPKYSQMKRFFN